MTTNRLTIETLKTARLAARKRFNQLAVDPEFQNCHDSHRAAKALETAEQVMKDSGFELSFGIEGHCGDFSEDCDESFQYVNLGDTYVLTVLYHRGQFRVGCWGDIVEAASR